MMPSFIPLANHQTNMLLQSDVTLLINPESITLANERNFKFIRLPRIFCTCVPGTLLSSRPKKTPFSLDLCANNISTNTKDYWKCINIVV